MNHKIKEIISITGLPVVVASLCCLSPIILVVVGVSTVSFAASLTDILYGDYKWAFRIVGLILLTLSYVLYLRRSGVCTLDDVKRRRQELINKFIIALIAAIVGYVFFLYVVVHYIGVWLSIWK